MHANSRRGRGSFPAHGMDGASVETRQEWPFGDVLFQQPHKSSINIFVLDISSDPSKSKRQSFWRWRLHAASLQERRQRRSSNSSGVGVVIGCAGSSAPALRKAVVVHLRHRVRRDGDRPDLPAEGLVRARHLYGPEEGQIARGPGDQGGFTLLWGDFNRG